MRLDSIRARVTLTFVASIGAVLAIVCGGLVWYARHSAEQQADSAMTAAAARMERDLLAEGPQAGFEDELHDLRAQNLAMLIVDRRNRLVRRSDGDAPSWPPPRDVWRIVSKPVGAYTVVIATRWDRTASALRLLALELLTVSICMLLVSAIGAWLLVGRTLSPIGALSRQAASASTDNLHVQLERPSDDAEVVNLVATLNGLLNRLADTAAARGRFYAAASHELRTPIQALSGHLDVARTRDRTNAEYRDAIDEAYAQSRRLAALVQDLLLLNQLDAASSRPPAELIDLADICERFTSQFQKAICERGLRVHMDVPDGIAVHGPPGQVEMLVRNLLENAAKYTAAHGAICVRIEARPSGALLEVFNECPPITPEALAKLFEPFYRPDESRDSSTGGNGLGLAICKAICAANKWNIAICPDPDGFRVHVDFFNADASGPGV